MDHNNSEMPPGDEQSDYAEKDMNKGLDCGVEEKYFPIMGKCCGMNNTSTGIAYQKTCPFCRIWTSLPDSVSLEVATILECQSHGYGKRIKE